MLPPRRTAPSNRSVGITFMDREEGESKLTMAQNVYYLQQLVHLYWDRCARPSVHAPRHGGEATFFIYIHISDVI